MRKQESMVRTLGLWLGVLCVLVLGSLRLNAQDEWERRSSAWESQQVALAEQVGGDVAGASVDALVDASFVHARIGAIDVRMPVAALEDAAWRARLLGSLAALAEAQVRWSEWSQGSDSDREQSELERERLGDLAKALRKLKPSKTRRLEVSAGMDLLRALELDEDLLGAVEVRPASAPVSTEQPHGSDEAAGAEGESPVRLVILHERGPFLGYVAAVGNSLSYLRDVFWNDDTETWLAIDHNSTRALSLSFFESGNPRGPGIPMDERNPKALEEHVTQVAARGLIERDLGDSIEPMLAAGLATELIIDLFGEADTYTDGDVAARETSARSVFIPGGNPNGGILPQVAADSRWRADRGRGFFVSVLRQSQKTGAKEAGRKAGKLVNFRLESRNSSKEFLVRAPFLGPGGSETAPPAAFHEDHLGFLRAYRTAFLHWLRTEAGGRRGASAQRFQKFLGALAAAPEDADPAALFEGVYDLPLSAADLKGEKSLEGEFLRWLSKQR